MIKLLILIGNEKLLAIEESNAGPDAEGTLRKFERMLPFGRELIYLTGS